MDDSANVLVVIPTYNRAVWLREAIESVLTQEYPDIKLVVVDDGSTEDIRGVCAPYVAKDPGGVIYVSQENRGCASARNRGLEFIDERTGYVGFLDSDDRFLPGKLRREVALLRRHPEAMFTYADSVLYDETTGRERRRRVAAAGQPSDFALQHFLTSEAKSAALLYRVTVFRSLRFRESMRYNEDSEFLQRVAIEYQGVYCPQPSCWVRDHAGGKSRDLIEIRKAELAACRQMIASYPVFSQRFAHPINRRMSQLRRGLLRELSLHNRWKEARPLAQGWFERVLVRYRLKALYAVARHAQLILGRRAAR